jgi:(1->4)-alpha-D-glucan 1-alpha-D-glucosylmutase
MTATYRLQLHAGFTFADAEDVAPYLADLGVTHLYLSPVLQAAPGSQHGYDVVDHTRVNAELGGLEGLERLANTARQHGLGLVLDVVPNHMALVAPENATAPLWDVLRHGRGADHAHWFDVDWDALDGRIGLPVLWESLDDVLAHGDLHLGEEQGEQVLRYHDHVFPIADGTWDGDANADVPAVLSRQHYRLAGWRESDTVLNYRRFFDVDTLVAVRVEEPDVFDATHELLLELNHRGLVEGFRIDHPDGLADPGGYLDRLRSRVRPGTAIWVEKILEGDEVLPEWACDGTTGYDATRAIASGLAERAIAPALTEAWEATGGEPSLARVLDESKRLVVADVLVPERARLLRRAREALPKVDAGRLGEAIDELLVSCTVYRAYVRPGQQPDELAVQRIGGAFDRARAARPDLDDELRELAGVTTDPAAAADIAAARDFAVRLQQTWGPVMAKGIEDTAFYRWHRLVALNEVGGDPDLLDDAAPERMHAWAEHQQRHWPLGMTTLSTHDTKRSEDVRARLLAVAGDGESWQAISAGFAEEAEARHLDGATAHLVWQTLLGAGDLDEERLSTYLTKAMREAKLRTSWLDPDPEYESSVIALATDATTPGSPHALVQTALDHNEEAVRALVLGQKLLQLTLPGVPDTYQGCELVDLSLVDPDNRRPVDFGDRRARLQRLLDGEPPRDLSDEKLLVTHRALTLRKQLPDSFGNQGEHHPLAGTSRHLVGFLRGAEVATLVTRGPARLHATDGWGDATVRLPDGLWRDELSGVLHEGAENLCSELFADYPVALLRKVHQS